MNGTTRCSHCQTRFRINEAQIIAHQGMVRCGRCLQAFDSRLSFVPDIQDPQLDLLLDEIVSEAPEPPSGRIPVAPVNASAEPVNAAPDVAHDFVRPVMPQPAKKIDDIDALTDNIMVTHGTIADTAGHFPPQSETPVDSGKPARRSFFTRKTDKSGVKVENEAASSSIDDPTLYQTRNAAHPKLWAAGVFLLFVLLLTQLTYLLRVELAAILPGMRPALVAACRPFGCSVPFPQQAELINIESSGIEATPGHENQITFNALLRNQSNTTLDYPVLSLTLNDTQDQPMARRYFTPLEYLPRDESIKTGFLVNHELGIKLHLNTGDIRPSGYRLELFESN
jgi:predicted Zn finger-like uncharacterized protein